MNIQTFQNFQVKYSRITDLTSSQLLFTGMKLLLVWALDNYDSFVPSFYKTNLIKSLIYRAFRICSTENVFFRKLIF